MPKPRAAEDVSLGSGAPCKLCGALTTVNPNGSLECSEHYIVG